MKQITQFFSEGEGPTLRILSVNVTNKYGHVY